MLLKATGLVTRKSLILESDCNPSAMASAEGAPGNHLGPALVSKGSLDSVDRDKICDQWVVEVDVARQSVLLQIASTVILAALHVLVMSATWLLSSWGGRVVTPINWYVGFDFYAILVSASHASTSRYPNLCPPPHSTPLLLATGVWLRCLSRGISRKLPMGSRLPHPLEHQRFRSHHRGHGSACSPRPASWLGYIQNPTDVVGLSLPPNLPQGSYRLPLRNALRHVLAPRGVHYFGSRMQCGAFPPRGAQGRSNVGRQSRVTPLAFPYPPLPLL